jgi:hypothetical protein
MVLSDVRVRIVKLERPRTTPSTAAVLRGVVEPGKWECGPRSDG